ncbi:MAG: hypothetical protein DMG76_03240 [Acidobacteria bacterium]|nr:MAG: hypothetical protein DMG76_03240 [Acidobacteriota bacterium]
MPESGKLANHMISKNVESGAPLAHWSKQTSASSRSREDLLLSFFTCLDRNHVRYCVLHSWDEIPQQLSSDLDIAVHPEDYQGLLFVFRLLKSKGYSLVQVINYYVESYCFRFLWFEGPTINSLAIDVIFKHQRGALLAPSVKLLLFSRRRHDMFWVPALEEEFTYLLARRIWKATAPARHQRRLKFLVERLGRPTAEKLAGKVLLGAVKIRIVNACESGRLNPLLAKGRRRAWQTSLVRNPLRLTADLLSDFIRLVRRWSHPTGLFISVMGPDGTVKNRLIEHLVQAVGPAFDRHKLFHWPFKLWRANTTREQARSLLVGLRRHGWAPGRLLAHFVEYWLGYWVVIRPVLARSGLVVFDGYFNEVLTDPERYPYEDTSWLARMLRRLIPQPDLMLVLDATEGGVLSRKPEMSSGETDGQRKSRATCGDRRPSVRVVNSTGSFSQLSAEATTIVIEHLWQRFERQHGPPGAFRAANKGRT